MTRINPNILIKQFFLKADWAEDGEDCRLEINLAGDTRSIHELTAMITEKLRDMFGNE